MGAGAGAVEEGLLDFNEPPCNLKQTELYSLLLTTWISEWAKQ